MPSVLVTNRHSSNWLSIKYTIEGYSLAFPEQLPPPGSSVNQGKVSAQMANCLINDTREPLVRVAAVCGRQGWPLAQPDIIVSTPAALLNYLSTFDPERKRRSDFLCNVKYVAKRTIPD